jgi:O-antigen/teichoic acid export membrane protein
VETRHLAGWFTVTQIVGQLQLQGVNFIVTGRLSKTDMSGLRGAQTALIQPTQNFAMAVQSLIVPRLSRLAGEAGASAARGDAEALAVQVASLRRQTLKLALGLGVVAVAVVAVYPPVARLALAHFDKFKDIAPLALPLSLQAGLYLIEVPFGAALRGMHRARLLFVRYLVYTTATLTALVIGANLDRLQGAAWGLTVGAIIGVTTMIVFYFLALHQLGKGVPTPEEPAELAPVTI